MHDPGLAIQKAAERGKRTFIYQFGDHDPSGILIPQSIKTRLDQMCSQLGCAPPIVRRAALTEKHIKKYRLTTRPTKRAGNTHATNFTGDSVELDALPPRVLRAMVTKVIERHVSPEATQALRVAEDSEREVLRAFGRDLN